MRRSALVLALIAAFSASLASAAEIHVALSGKDSNPGTLAAPLRSIQKAADLARPGDVITVHAGVYRERVSPPRGGSSEAKRITYQAAPGEKVEITGSEIAKGWEKVRADVWKVSLPNPFFGGFNPYRDLIRGDWFEPKKRDHHTGAVYLNGEWLAEAARLDDVLGPVGPTPLWFGRVDGERTTIWAQFKGVDPNSQLVEINARRTVFYPEKTGIDYLTVRGFIMRQAATPWAPPTAEQIGLLGTHWSKGWIIEGNTISHSICAGIALGKYGDEFDNTSKDTAEGYVKTIDRALRNGWAKASCGGHIVRNNTISHCEQAGIVGSLGAAFSTIAGNTIHDIHVRQLFTGAEMAGIKLHGAIDVEIRGNHIFRTVRGIWLDWMAQGARVTGNLFHDNLNEDLFVEVDHGPFLVDNNLFLSPSTLLSVSQGGAYVHNLVAGSLRLVPFDARLTPFHKAHSTELAGMHDNPFGDDRWFNNILVGRADLSLYDAAPLAVAMDGNVFLNGAKPSRREKSPLVQAGPDSALRLVEKPDGLYLEFDFAKSWADAARSLVTSERLGKAAIPDLPYERPDGTPLRVDADYFGRGRKASGPTPGPFEEPGRGPLRLKAGQGAVLSRADEAFWKDQARRIVDTARLPAGGSSGSWRNTTPYDLHVPGGNMGYPAFWVRDAAMMLGGDFVPAAEIEGWIRLVAAALPGPSDWTVRPGVVVPAYSVADHINFDGKPVFYPGIYDSGAKQGGPPWGKYPPLDDAFYFIGMAYEHWKATGSLALFRTPLKTSFGEERLDELCDKVYRVPAFDRETGLIRAGDVDKENAKDWGFCDAESKSGKLLFPSLLKLEAARRLSDMFEAAGRADRARFYREEAARLTAAVRTTFLRPAAGGTEAWLRSATAVGDQDDVWGSAFAVASGALDGAAARAVALALRRAFLEKRAFREGCVRQILTTDKAFGGGWQISIVKPDEYQNGGYWGTPTGWAIAAIAVVDRPAAANLAADFVGFLRRHARPDGLAEAWEWFHPDTGKNNNPLYVATVALPYLSLLRGGLLGTGPSR